MERAIFQRSFHIEKIKIDLSARTDTLATSENPLMKRKQIAKCLVAVASLMSFAVSSSLGGTFTNDFNSIQVSPDNPDQLVPPDGTAWYGQVGSGIAAGYDHRTGGVTGGAIKLANAIGSQNGGSFIVSNLDADAVPDAFDINFQMLIGGGNGADGLSVAVGDFASAAWGEEGPGTIKGLSIIFDVFNNGGTVAEAPAIDLKWNNVIFAHKLLPIGTITTLRPNAYVPVRIKSDAAGKVSVTYNNVAVYTDMPIYRASEIVNGVNGWRVGFGARTGGSFDNFWIDNLGITTTVTDPNDGQPYITAITPVNPIDQNASSIGGISVTLKDATFSIATNTIKFLYNNAAVTAPVTISRTKSDPNLASEDLTTITYLGPNGVLPSGAATATISYFTTSTPAVSNLYTFNFTIQAATALPVTYKLTTLDETKAGFKARVYQMDRFRSPGDQNITPVGERQLAYGFMDPITHLPAADISVSDAFTSNVDTNGYFVIPDVLNFEQAGLNAGQVTGASNPSRQEKTFPGIPAPGTRADGIGQNLDANAGNFALEYVGYLKLKAGGYRFGLFADDRFRFSFGNSFDAVGFPAQAASTGANAETIFDVLIAEDGYYPFRCGFWEGGGGASFEFYWINPTTGQKVLINDPTILEAPRAFYDAAGTRPWVKRVLPVENWVGAFPNEKVLAEIVDGPNTPIVDSSIKMQINNVDQTVTKTKVGGITDVVRVGSDSSLLPSGLNTARIIYSYVENGTTITKTNQWAFSVAPYYNVVPAANKVAAADINTADLGFNGRYYQIDRLLNGPNDQAGQGRITGGGDGNRMPNPEIELWGLELNVTNGLAYPNIANPGPNANYTTTLDWVNFNDVFTAPTGTAPGTITSPNTGFFQSGSPAFPLPGGSKTEVSAPGVPSPNWISTNGVAAGVLNPSNGGLDNYVLELTTYLDLKAGVHVFGFNSDDGFVATSAPNPKDTLGTMVGFFSGGRGNANQAINTGNFAPAGGNPPTIQPGVLSGSSLFTVIIPEDGIYPFRFLYWNGGGGINGELFSVDQETGTYVLIGDLGASWGDGTPAANIVPAYRTYTGPARPWTKFSVSPNPWDNRLQQAGPGPMAMYGRTRNSLQSVDIYNWQDVLPVSGTLGNSGHWGDVNIGGIIANGAPGGVADASIRLLLDGVDVPATKVVTNTTDLLVIYHPNPVLASASTHTAALVYAGTTNTWKFTVQKYATLNAADAVTGVDTNAKGFSMKLVQQTAALAGTAAAAEAILTNTAVVNIAATNSARSDGRYILPDIINFNNNNANNPTGATVTQLGNFQDASFYGPGWPFPGTSFYFDRPVPAVSSANLNNFAAEIFAYVQFPTAGFYRFGANADDGFLAKIGNPGVNTGQVLITMDRGAGPQDFPFGVNVPAAGFWPVRFVWYQGTGGAALELFTYDQNLNNNKHALNDPNDPASLKVFYALQGASAPQIVNTALSGGNITFTWTGGGELQTASSILGPWTGTGNTTGSASIPASGAMAFYRIAK
jgi:hypothetical protein